MEAANLHAMVYDSGRGVTVLFGGEGPRPNTNMFADTWEWDGRRWARRTLATSQVGSSLATGPIPIDTRKLGLGFDPLLDISVNGYWPGTFVGYRGVLDTSGLAIAGIRIPGVKALIGLSIHSAFVTLKPLVPSGVKSISNTFSFVITST